ncbi:hypothetical protein D1872_277350 [compost metagenome]
MDYEEMDERFFPPWPVSEADPGHGRQHRPRIRPDSVYDHSHVYQTVYRNVQHYEFEGAQPNQGQFRIIQ